MERVLRRGLRAVSYYAPLSKSYKGVIGGSLLLFASCPAMPTLEGVGEFLVP